MTIFSGRGLSSIYTILFRMLKDECSKEKFKLNHIPLEDFTNCLWQKKPNVLPIWIAYRFILFIYFLATFAVTIFYRPEKDFVWYKNFIYVAYWAYFAEVLAFGLAFAVSLEKFIKERKKPPSYQEEIKEEEEEEGEQQQQEDKTLAKQTTPWHFKALWCVYTIAASSALSVSIMFWFFIYHPDMYGRLGFSIVARVLNSVFLLLDVFLNGIPFRFLHFYIPCAFMFVYLTFTIIYQASGGTGNGNQIPIYVILDWRKPKQAMSTVAIYVTCSLLFHCGMCVINIFKNWLKKPSE